MHIFEYAYGEKKAMGMIDEAYLPAVATRFRALSDEGRLRLLSALQSGEKSVGELARLLGRSQPNVSQHLANLAHCGLVAARREGNRAYYRISDPTVLRICDAVCASLGSLPRADANPPSSRGRRRRSEGGK